MFINQILLLINKISTPIAFFWVRPCPGFSSKETKYTTWLRTRLGLKSHRFVPWSHSQVNYFSFLQFVPSWNLENFCSAFLVLNAFWARSCHRIPLKNSLPPSVEGAELVKTPAWWGFALTHNSTACCWHYLCKCNQRELSRQRRTGKKTRRLKKTSSRSLNDAKSTIDCSLFM